MRIIRTLQSRVLSSIFNTFRTAAPFWGKLTLSLTGLSPKRDCAFKRVIYIYFILYTWYIMTNVFHLLYITVDLTQSLINVFHNYIKIKVGQKKPRTRSYHLIYFNHLHVSTYYQVHVCIIYYYI